MSLQLNGVVCSALVMVAIHYGLGRHYADIESEYNKIQAFKYTIIAPCFSVVCTTVGKLSIVMFLLRLMGRTATSLKKWTLYILAVVCVIWNAVAIGGIIGLCQPIARVWDASIPGTCLPVSFQVYSGLSDTGL